MKSIAEILDGYERDCTYKLEALKDRLSTDHRAAYIAGLTDMYQAIEETFMMTDDEREKYLGSRRNMGFIFEKFTAQELVDIIKDYQADERMEEVLEGGRLDKESVIANIGEDVKETPPVEITPSITINTITPARYDHETNTTTFTGKTENGKEIEVVFKNTRACF